MKRTTAQNNRLHGLLTKLGLDLDAKEDLVTQFTNCRTVRSSEMTAPECQQLILHLQNQLGSDNQLDRQRKRVIANLAEAGHVTDNGKPDMPAIYAWTRRQKHKLPLNQLNSSQLGALIYASEQVRDHYLNQYDKQR